MVVAACHEHDGYRVHELAHEADHLVVLLGREHRDAREAEHLPQVLAPFDGFRRVLLGWHDHVVRVMEHALVAVLHAVAFLAGHGVRGDEFHVGTQHVLNVVHDAALHARHVGDEDARLEQVLVFGHPLLEHVRVQREDDGIGLAHQLFAHLRRAFVHDAVFERVFDSLRIGVDGHDVIPQPLERTGIAAADEPEAHDEHVVAVYPFHSMSPFSQSAKLA